MNQESIPPLPLFPAIIPDIPDPGYGFKLSDGHWYVYEYKVHLTTSEVLAVKADKGLKFDNAENDGWLHFVQTDIPAIRVKYMTYNLIRII